MVKKTFRDGSYYRHVWFGKRTVKEGECAAIWQADGRRRVVEGPKRVRLFFAHVRFLNRYVADQHEFLHIQFRDGRKEHRRGPLALFMDPCTHLAMKTREAFRLKANEALVVYSEEEAAVRATEPKDGVAPAAAAANAAPFGAEKESKPGAVQRRVVRGPAVVVPAAHEWVHEFTWSSTKSGSAAVSFQVLRTLPDQMEVSCEVRTSDDAHVTFELLLRFELSDIELMLNATNDPIGDFVRAAEADATCFGASHTYESLLQRLAQLSELDTFPTLRSCMAQTGFELSKVVYRGHSTTQALEAMHEQSVAQRARRRLEADTRPAAREQSQQELQAKQERSKAEMALAEAELRHKLEMLAVETEAQRKARDEDHQQTLRHEAERETAAQQARRARNDEELRRDAALKDLGVDLTKVLVAGSQSAPDHTTLIKLDAGADASGMPPPAIHLDVKQGGAGAARV